MKVEEVEEIAQGRVWSGVKGKNVGLVDTIGGLQTAIMIAKEKARIPKSVDAPIIELPRPQLISSEFFQPKLLQSESDYSEFIQYLNFLSKNNGDVLLIIPIEDFIYFKKIHLK